MLQQHRNWYRTLAAALAVGAIAPATAAGMPATDGQGTAPIQGQGVAAGGGPGVTPQTLTKPQSLAAPDQVDRKDGWQPSASSAPTWPVNPQPIGHAPSASQPSNDGGGLDTDVWIAIGGAALVAAGGLGVAGRRRVQTKRQPA